MIVSVGSSIYNAPSIYAIGAGSGVEDTIKIDGNEYEFVRVGNRYYTTENLKNLFNGAITLNGSYSEATARWFGDNEIDSIAKKYNLAYTKNAVDVINSFLVDGWRVNTHDDVMYLKYFGSISKLLLTGTNDFGLSLVKNGNCDTNGSPWYSVGSTGGIITKTHFISFSDSFYDSTLDRWAAIRLVKDV